MSEKQKDNKDRLVYTTHPGEGNSFFDDLGQDKAKQGSKFQNQKIYVFLDRKQRKGKEVTCIEGYQSNPQDKEKLARELKSACGAGGAVKEGLILIQGNHVDKIVEILRDKGFGQVKIKGGY